jgi:spore coat polysaccharide biosynthesis protein SpsF (cytidylyltransferase family)
VNPPVRAFVEACMASRRFPGKLLAPFRGEPVIRHLLRAIERVLPPRAIIVVTTDAPSDDPLVAYLGMLDVQVFRGPRNDAFERFRRGAREHPCKWILRVSADSPLLDPEVLRTVLAHANRRDLDLVTTGSPEAPEPGRSAELIRSTKLLAIPADDLESEDREHVTRFFHRHAQKFKIASVAPAGGTQAPASLAADTVEELQRLEREGPPTPPPPPEETRAPGVPAKGGSRRARVTT